MYLLLWQRILEQSVGIWRGLIKYQNKIVQKAGTRVAHHVGSRLFCNVIAWRKEETNLVRTLIRQAPMAEDRRGEATMTMTKYFPLSAILGWPIL
jgi:hypothetical protein